MPRSPSSASHRSRDAPTPLPWSRLSPLFIVLLAENVTYTVIYPFIAQLVIELGVTHDPARAGYFAGLVESVFFVLQAACVLHWGRLSDRIGRRPVLMLGLCGVAASQICFGLASGRHGSFIAVIGARALAGALNGNVAPLLGGGLAHPHERFPGSIFAKLEFFKEYPYILPCGAAALVSLFACLVTAIWFHETSEPIEEDYPPSSSSSSLVHSNTEESVRSAASAARIQSTVKNPALPCPERTRTPTVQFSAPQTPTGERTPLLKHQSDAASAGNSARSASRPSVREIMTPRLRAALVAYSLLAFTEISYLGLQPLYFSSPTSAGGLGLSTSTIGLWMGGASALNAFVQAFGYPRLHARWGEKRVFVAGSLAFTLIWPAWIAGWLLAASLDATTDDGMHWSTAPGASWVWALLASSFGLYNLLQFCYASIFQFVNKAAPRSALGSANGLAQMCASTMRAVGPITLTSLWSWSAGWLRRTNAHSVTSMKIMPAAMVVAGPIGVSLSQAQVNSIEVGGVVIPWQAAMVYVVMELFSIALVWAGTRLVEGQVSESKPGSRVRTPSEEETA
ncbi:MFS general substrate transporter [Auriculariales sp. MPI-PUGE-AT-0066]|nr:MFS general substrate transporter [Auriculariales sp. MPI-PUGE-AT-0066]